MAAIPPHMLGLAASEEKAKTTFSFSSNELGAHSYFPSSEVSSMPTLALIHEATTTRPYPKLTTTARLNEEFASFGAGLSKEVGPFTMWLGTERLVQRQPTVYKKRDLGWQHTVSIEGRVLDNARVEASVVKKTTDSSDKNVTDMRIAGCIDSALGSFQPEYTMIRRGDGKTGKKVKVALASSPFLSKSGVTLHASHTLKTWGTAAAAFTASEVGLTIPATAGRLSVGAVRANSEQDELLQNSSLLAFPVGASSVGLKLAFSADL